MTAVMALVPFEGDARGKDFDIFSHTKSASLLYLQKYEVASVI